MRKEEGGFILILVLILLAVGTLFIFPTLQLASTALGSKQTNTVILKDQYTRDGCVEYAMWKLLYGDAADLLLVEGAEEEFNSCELNNLTATVTLTMQAKLGDALIGGAEDNKIRPTNTVECDIDGSGDYGDDCLNLPVQAGMLARFTVFLDQVSPDTSDPLVVLFEELPEGFVMDLSSVVSLDGSFPEIESAVLTPVDIQPGVNWIWKWDFSASPISFTQGQVKQFTFEANIDGSTGRYCNDVWLKLQNSPPFEHMGKQTDFLVGGSPPDGCRGAGFSVRKFTDQPVALPNVTTIFTYIVNVENLTGNTEQIDGVKDVLPQGGFQYCNGTTQGDPLQTCDPPMIKLADTPFDPATDDFNVLTGFTPWDEPTETLVNDRWELQWTPSPAISVDQAGNPGDVFILRFQAEITPETSGAYYNEIFIDAQCSVPSSLNNEGITSDDYCSTYSWPTAGTVVPTYDVGSQTDISLGQGNITVDWGTLDGTLESWHVN